MYLWNPFDIGVRVILIDSWRYWSLIRLGGCCSVAKSCLTLQDPKYCSTPDSPILHYLSELLKFMSIESVMLSNRLILCFLLLLPSIFASTRVFSNEWALHNVLKFTELVYSKSGIISRQTDSRAQALNSFLTLSPLVERLGTLWPGWTTLWLFLNHLHVTNFHFDLLCALNTDSMLNPLLGPLDKIHPNSFSSHSTKVFLILQIRTEDSITYHVSGLRAIE